MKKIYTCAVASMLIAGGLCATPATAHAELAVTANTAAVDIASSTPQWWKTFRQGPSFALWPVGAALLASAVVAIPVLIINALVDAGIINAPVLPAWVP